MNYELRLSSFIILHSYFNSAMQVRTLTSGEDLRRYNEWILTHPQGNLWQSLEWKRYQESLGRSVKIYVEEDAGRITASAMVTIDHTLFGLSTWDISRGPLGKVQKQFLNRIISDAKTDRCMTLYLSAPLELLNTHQLRLAASHRCEQLESTIILDLNQSEEQILSQMHQKARYNIKTARRHGVTISQHTAHDQKALDSLYTLLMQTAARDGFTHLPRSHYEAFLQHLEGSFFLMAWHDQEPVAGLLGVAWKDLGFYYYGASSYGHRNLMAPYLLQWEAMLYCKKAGCTRYDLLGIAPEGAGNDNPWAGITEFKRKFGGTIESYPPEQMIVLKPMTKKLLEWKRAFIG